MEFALGKAGELFAGIAEHDATGAEGINELGDEFLTGVLVAFEEGLGVAVGAGGAVGEVSKIFFGRSAAVGDALDHVGEGHVIGGLGDEVV